MTIKIIAIDPEKCVGCQICDLVCSAVKENSYRPNLGRIHTVRIEPITNIAVTCQFCENAPCVLSCPRDALTQEPNTGIIRIDQSKCTGCGWCIESCDFGAIVMHPEEKIVTICDLCEQEDEGPLCIPACPKEAIKLQTRDRRAQKRRVKTVELLSTAIGELEESGI